MNFLKKPASYIIDILLEQKASVYNPVLKLYLSKGQLKLVTSGAVYSYGNLYYNFRESFDKLNISNKKFKNILILGLGTGSIIQLLEQKFDQSADYDLVEIDPVVIELFEKYKSEFIVSRNTVYNSDAIQFVNTNQKKYDLICMDIFCDRTVPEIFESQESLMNLRNALNKNGLLLYNRLAIDEMDRVHNENFFRTFQNVFPEATIIKMEFNWMLVAD